MRMMYEHSDGKAAHAPLPIMKWRVRSSLLFIMARVPRARAKKRMVVTTGLSAEQLSSRHSTMVNPGI